MKTRNVTGTFFHLIFGKLQEGEDEGLAIMFKTWQLLQPIIIVYIWINPRNVV
jgi:hypothetical protein